jgi:ABC-type polysaccharide/polyol phosphate export permease
MSTARSTPVFVASLAAGVRDLRAALGAHELWAFMGWQDIRQRYRRTILGPWWLAISTGLLVVLLGFLWSEIFAVDARAFLPFFGIGYVLWTFLAGATLEACTGFTQFEGILKQRRVPLSAFLLRIAVRHAVALAHNAIVVALLVAWAGPQWSAATLLAIPGLAMFVGTVTLSLIPVAVFCTRFRDFPQIVGNLLQVAFFATPIMWRPEAVRNLGWIVEYNPFAHLIDIVREPLLGRAPSVDDWTWSLGLLALSFVAAACLLGRYGRRVAYWL